MKTNKVVIGMALLCVAFLVMLPWIAMAVGPAEKGLNGSELVARGKPVKEDNPNKGGGKNKDPTPDPEPTTGKYALVIGISNYDGTQYDLQYCDDDARDWASYLKGQGYSVHTLIDGQATYSKILSEVDWLVAQEAAGDEVVFTYSGHGAKSGKDSCIITYELSYLSATTLKSKFDPLDSTHAFFFFDACQIGSMKSLVGTGRYVAMGSTTRTNAYDGTSSMSNGVFTYYYMQALEDQGYTTAEDAFDYAEYKSESTYPMDCISADGYTGLMVL